MSYDLDILAKDETQLNAATETLKAFLAARENYELWGDEYCWTMPGTEDGLQIGILTTEMRENPETEDDPRAIGWITFNYLRDDAYYQAVIAEIQAILTSGAYDLYDPQTDAIWHDRFEPDIALGVIDDAIFSAIVLMVMITTLMAPPLLKILLAAQSRAEKVT